MRKLSTLIFVCTAAIARAQDAYEAGITLSPDEKYFAVGNASTEIRLFRVSNGKFVRRFRCPSHNVGDGFFTKPAFSPNGTYLTAGNLGPDGGVNPIWRVSDGKVVARVALWAAKDSPSAMNVVGFSGDGKFVLGSLYGEHDQMLAHTVATWRHAYFVHNWKTRSTAAAICPKGSLVASVNSEIGLRFWDPESEPAKKWEGWPVREPEGIRYMAFSGDGNVLVFAGDGWCARLDPRLFPKGGVIMDTGRRVDNTVRPKKTVVVPSFIVRSVCASGSGKEAFLGGRDGRIARFDLATGKLLRIWKGFKDPVKGLALTRNGKTLLAYNLSEVRYWNAVTGKLRGKVTAGPVRRMS
ncbi:MAG: WD40 repeat domain-containing protein [Armatimonadetes bacterium]|nr:WD40 repeat domain-containing protein [Armatimonadota bacterium]